MSRFVLEIGGVGYCPAELHDQVPIAAHMLKKIPGDDGVDYWLARVDPVLRWRRGQAEVDVTHVVLSPRIEGSVIEPGVSELAVGIAYVTDVSVLDDDHLSFHKCEYVAIGLAHDPESARSSGQPTE